MSQQLLFAVGLAVFAVTLVATLLYGSLMLNRIYQADAAERAVVEVRPAMSGNSPAMNPQR